MKLSASTGGLTIEYTDQHSTRNRPAYSVIVVSVQATLFLSTSAAIATPLLRRASGQRARDAAQRFRDEPARIILAGCSERPSSKAAASAEARRTLRYVEPLSAARTMLADFINSLRAIRWPRVYSGSDSHLDPCNPLHVGAEIAETGGDQPKGTAFSLRQCCSIDFIDEYPVLSRLLEREAGGILPV